MLGTWLRLGKGEERSGGRNKERILAACYEAVIGAVWQVMDTPQGYPYLYTPRLPTPYTDNEAAWGALPGKTAAEKLGSLGVSRNGILDIRMLDEISRSYGIEVFLFFEEDLARTRTLESVLEEFAIFPEYGRPYITIESFLRFTRENGIHRLSGQCRSFR